MWQEDHSRRRGDGGRGKENSSSSGSLLPDGVTRWKFRSGPGLKPGFGRELSNCLWASRQHHGPSSVSEACARQVALSAKRGVPDACHSCVTRGLSWRARLRNL
jgi:hypothetical protein